MGFWWYLYCTPGQSTLVVQCIVSECFVGVLGSWIPMFGENSRGLDLILGVKLRLDGRLIWFNVLAFG